MVRDVSGHEVRALQHELVLKDILAAADKLAPFPDIVWKVMPLLQRMAPIAEIEAVIKYDQAIAARVLSMAQSAYYARKQPIASLHDAIARLGNRKLVQVIMAACAARYLQTGGRHEDGREQQLWEHSVSVAIMAEHLARRLQLNNVLKAYLAGLLHDIGQTVLSCYARIYIGPVWDESAIDSERTVELERRLLGIDHQRLGALIARQWRLPTEVVIGIGYHHHPFEAKSESGVALVLYAADKISRLALSSDNAEHSWEPESDRAFMKLGIAGPQTIEQLKDQLVEAMRETKTFLSSEQPLNRTKAVSRHLTR